MEARGPARVIGAVGLLDDDRLLGLVKLFLFVLLSVGAARGDFERPRLAEVGARGEDFERPRFAKGLCGSAGEGGREAGLSG